MIKNAIFLSCDAGIALVCLNSKILNPKFQTENFVKVIGAVCVNSLSIPRNEEFRKKLHQDFKIIV